MMLTETRVLPVKSDLLTFSRMADGHLHEDGGTRPKWELEAEILRLTTKLMMREQELREVRGQMKTQTERSQQLVATWKRRVEEKEEQLRQLVVQKDAEMQTIVFQLQFFERELRREQSRIERLLQERDSTIQRQCRELDQLRSAWSGNDVTGPEDTPASSSSDTSDGLADELSVGSSAGAVTRSPSRGYCDTAQFATGGRDPSPLRFAHKDRKMSHHRPTYSELCL